MTTLTVQDKALSILEIDVLDIELETGNCLRSNDTRWVVRVEGKDVFRIPASVKETNLFDTICFYLPANKVACALINAKEILSAQTVDFDYN
jgi:hypothetical protein